MVRESFPCMGSAGGCAWGLGRGWGVVGSLQVGHSMHCSTGRSWGPAGAKPLADGPSWGYRGAGVGFGRQCLKRDVSCEPGGGLSRSLHAREL